ncbi:MAG: hypothetical protein K2P81_02180 [Bacteriovoracaceae bacterium]|nr:hypothetical protein [Bacteriovoracaceae bacterium]
MKYTFVLALLSLTLQSWATSLPELDQKQLQLSQEYMAIYREYSPEQIKILLQNGDQEAIVDGLTKIESFFKKYDDFNLEKIDYFFDYGLKRAQAEANEFLKTHKKLPKKVQTHLTNIEKDFRIYQERKAYFGSERDTERLDVGQEVLHHYGNFATELRKAQGEKAKRIYGAAKILPFIDSPIDAIRTADQFIRVLWAAYFRTRTGKPGIAPITNALTGVQARLVKMRGIEAKWEGMENLGDLSYDGKTLNMFLMNHANSFYDTSAEVTFPVKEMSTMGNVDIFFPGFLARRMVKSDHIIAVGHGDTTGRTIDLIKRKQLNRFFLAAEGITGTGLYEMRPVMPLLNYAVYEAIDRGLELQLYPVVFPDNFRLLNDWRNPIEGKIVARGVLHPPINNEMCLTLKSMTESMNSIGQLLRWTWFESLNNNQNEILSMPMPSEINQRLEKMVWED